MFLVPAFRLLGLFTNSFLSPRRPVAQPVALQGAKGSMTGEQPRALSRSLQSNDPSCDEVPHPSAVTKIPPVQRDAATHRWVGHARTPAQHHSPRARHHRPRDGRLRPPVARPTPTTSHPPRPA